MDNFKKKNYHARPNAIDGFIGPARRGQISDKAGEAFRRPQSYQPSRQVIGDFRRPEGYHPAQRKSSIGGQAVSSTSVVDEILDNQPKRRNRKFSKSPRSRSSGKKRLTHRLFKKPSRRMIMTFALVALLGTGGFFGFNFLKARNIFRGGGGAAALNENVDPTELNGEGDGRVNVLLLGRGGVGHEAPDLTDTILLASIDPINKSAALLSIPRDLYVRVPQYGQMKINAAYAAAKHDAQSDGKSEEQAEDAGLVSIQKTIENSMGVPVHYYAIVDFEAFRQAIDTVGGVEIDVKERLYDATIAWENGNNPLIAKEGMQTFNGKRALLYARSRHGSARGDFDRAARQREIIFALQQKVLSAGTLANPVKVTQLADAFGDHMRTNMSVGHLMRLYEITKDISGSQFASIGLADPPNNFITTAAVGNQSVVIPRAGMSDFSEIQAYVRNALRDGFIQSEDAKVLILNGTGVAGLATKKSTELKSYGYNVLEVGDAPTNTYTQTILVDLRKKDNKYTRRYLEQRLNVSAVEKLPDQAILPGEADFVIILGSNETN